MGFLNRLLSPHTRQVTWSSFSSNDSHNIVTMLIFIGEPVVCQTLCSLHILLCVFPQTDLHLSLHLCLGYLSSSSQHVTPPSTLLSESKPCKPSYSPPPPDALSKARWLTLQNAIFSVSAASALHQAVVSFCSGRWCSRAGSAGLTLAPLPSVLHSQARLLFFFFNGNSVPSLSSPTSSPLVSLLC